MAIAHVQKANSSSAGSGTSVSLSFGAAVSSGDLIVGMVSYSSGTTDVTTVTTDKGDTATIVDQVADATNTEAVAGFYFPNITDGSQTITVNFGAVSELGVVISLDEYSGVATSSPVDNSGTAHSLAKKSALSSTWTSNAITTVTDGCLIYGYVQNTTAAGPITAGSGFTIENNGVGNATEDQVQGTAGSISSTFGSGGTGSGLIGVIAFKPAAGGDTLLGQACL